MSFPALLLLFDCASAPPQQAAYASYAEMVINRPLPQDDAARAQECRWIQSELQRQRAMAAYAASAPALPQQQRARQMSEAHTNNAALEARLSKVGCGIPPQHVAPPPGPR